MATINAAQFEELWPYVDQAIQTFFGIRVNLEKHRHHRFDIDIDYGLEPYWIYELGPAPVGFYSRGKTVKLHCCDCKFAMQISNVGTTIPEIKFE